LLNAGNLGQDLVDGQRSANATREPRQDRVGSRSLAVDETIGQALQALAERLERQRHGGCRHKRQEQVRLATRPQHRTDASDDAYIDQSNSGR